MCNMYDKLSPMHKGLVQIVIGATTVLYVFGIFPYWIPLLASLALIAHGLVHAGFYAQIQKMMRQANHSK